MLFHANNIQNRAVWNAMKLHAKLIINSGENLIFIVPKKNIHILSNTFPNNSIIIYNTPRELINQVVCNNDKKIFCPDYISVLTISICKLFKKLDIYFWMQGIIPEESFMRHNSMLRKYILSIFEFIAIKISSFQVFSSSYMEFFIKKKYSIKTNNIIVPCTSDLSYSNSKKILYSFVYVGGLSAWQKFDQILLMFDRFSKNHPEAKLYVATGEKIKAQRLCNQYLRKETSKKVSIKNIEGRGEMLEFLNTMQFGFLIRADDPVNNVASPIKLAEYLSTGVNVIISSSLTSYASEIETEGAGIMVENINDIDKINDFQFSLKKSILLYNKIFSQKKLIEAYQSIL